MGKGVTIFLMDGAEFVSNGNEAIDLSKQFSNADAKRFINGILDRLKDQLGRDARKAE